MSEENGRDEGVTAQISGLEILELAAQVRLLIPTLEKLSEKIMGNGKIGLEQRMDRVEVWIENFEKLCGRAAPIALGCLTPVAIAVVLAVLFFVAGVLTHRIDILFH